jgi:Cof subfamily protein (haloacid dehalogenase superfamily)
MTAHGAAPPVRLLAVDLDHTLLGSDWQLSERNRDAIRRATASGVRVVIATGRMPGAALAPLAALRGAISYLICYNGALVLDGARRSALLSITVPPSAARAVSSFAARRDCLLAFFHDDEAATPDGRSGRDQDLVLSHYRRRTGVKFADRPLATAHKCIIYHGSLAQVYDPLVESSAEASLHAELLALAIPGLSITRTGLGYVECTAEGASKAAAVEWILARHGWTTRSLMAIGDGYNDIAMIEAAGVGVAVGNAVQPCRRAADLVVADNDADGVAIALREILNV